MGITVLGILSPELNDNADTHFKMNSADCFLVLSISIFDLEIQLLLYLYRTKKIETSRFLTILCYLPTQGIAQERLDNIR